MDPNVIGAARPCHHLCALGRHHCLVPWCRRAWHLSRCRPPRLHLPYHGPQCYWSRATVLPVTSRSCCRTTSPSRISLLSWVWTSYLRRTRSRSRGRGRLRGSCPSPSRSPRCSPTTPASLSPLLRLSPDSRKSLLA